MIALINCLAVKTKLRPAYWCIELPKKKIVKLAEKMNLKVCLDRLIYSPDSPDPTHLFKNNSTENEVARGKLLGYPTPGESWGQWWISWQVRDKKYKFHTLFNFQMNKLNTKKLIKMKEKWNSTLPQYYFDFEIRYRKNCSWSDEIVNEY